MRFDSGNITVETFKMPEVNEGQPSVKIRNNGSNPSEVIILHADFIAIAAMLKALKESLDERYT